MRMRLRSGEHIEGALKRFKKLIERSGIRTEMKRTAYYEKPSERRRRAERKRLKKIHQAASGIKPGPKGPKGLKTAKGPRSGGGGGGR